jgi:glycosyltransferase involved in cell wall biosynthesis
VLELHSRIMAARKLAVGRNADALGHRNRNQTALSHHPNVTPDHARPPSVLLVADSQTEGMMSMDLYAAEVFNHLNKSDAAGQIRMLQVGRSDSTPQALKRLRITRDRYISLPKEVSSAREEVVHVLDQTYAHLVAHARVPIVVTCHDLIPLSEDRWSVGHWLYHRAVRQLRKAQRVVAISDATASVLEARLKISTKRISVIPYGIDSRFFTSEWQRHEAPLRILHVGVNYAYKRIWLAVQTACRLATKHQGIEFWKVGTPIDGELAQVLATAGVKLVNLGRLPSSSLPEIYASVSLLIYPSREEGFGRPVVEALAVGLPVIASAIKALEEVSGGNAVHVSGSTPAAYEDAIEELLRDPRRQAQLSAAGREWARRFSWDEHASALADIYAAVAVEGPAR